MSCTVAYSALHVLWERIDRLAVVHSRVWVRVRVRVRVRARVRVRVRVRLSAFRHLVKHQPQ